jgi:hypothetical protein
MISRFRKVFVAIATILLEVPAVHAATLYASDYVNGKIIKINPSGAQLEFASVVHAFGLATDGSGNVFVSTNLDGQVIKLLPMGAQSTFALFSKPVAIAIDLNDPLKSVFVGDQGVQTVFKVTAAGAKSPFATGIFVSGMAFNQKGELFAADALTSQIFKFDKVGGKTLFASGFGNPQSLTFDRTGTVLYVTDTTTGQIVQIGADKSQKPWVTGLNVPLGLAIDENGSIFVAENGSGRILKIAPGGATPPSIFFAGPPTTAFLAFDPPCTYTLSSSSFSASATSGTGSVNVTTNLASCAWTATSPVSWLTITGGTPGLGTGTVTFSYQANTSTALQSETLTIAGQLFAFTQSAGQAAPPAITSLAPSLVVAGSGPFTLSVIGSNFVSGSTVLWNGTPLPTSFVSATQLTASVLGSLIATPASALVTVSNSGVISNSQKLVFTPLVSTLSRVGVLPQLAAGGGWDTAIYLTNTSVGPISVALSFRGDDGAALTLPVTATQQGNAQTSVTSTLNAVIPQNTTLAVGTGTLSATVQGWADVLSNGTLTGFAVFRYAPQGLRSGSGITTPWEGTVPLQTQLSPTAITVPFDNTNGFATGVALGNLTASVLNLTATFYDDSGNPVGWPQTLSLAGNGHTSFVLSSQYAFIANAKGIMRVTGGALMGLGLRASPYGTLTAVPLPLQ